MSLRILASLAVVVAAGPYHAAAAPAAHAAHAPRAPFSWPGVYDLVGTDFPDGARHALLSVERADTTYHVAIDGPPGRVEHFAIRNDSAHVVWNFGDGSQMYVDLRGAGDSVWGRWQSGAYQGPIKGTRRR